MSLNSPVSRAAAEPDAIAAAARHEAHAAPAAEGGRRDLSMLAWLAPSLRTALEDAAAEFGRYVDEVQQAPEALGARDTTSLRLAGQQLHQAAGAVHIVGLRGIDAYCQALRRLLEAVDAGTAAASADTHQVFRQGVQALAEYVDDLLAGEPDDPLRLFRNYADVLALLSEERVHPADLWVDDVQMLPGILLPTRLPAAVARARQRFEAALLGALRLPTPCTDAEQLQQVYLPLVRAMQDVRAGEQEARRSADHPDRGVWHVLSLVFEALAHGLLPSDLLAKRFAARAHLLLRQYVQGQVRVPQALLNDAIFLLVATGLAPDAERSAPALALRAAIRQCLQAFRLDAAHLAVEADFRQRYYGWLDGIDTGNLQQAAAGLERAARGDAAAWHTALAALAEAAQPLSQPALLRCLDVAAGGEGAAAGTAAGTAAEALALFLARALATPWRVHGKSGHAARLQFAQRCEELASCLAAGATAPSWLVEMVAQAQAQEVRRAAVAQLRAQLDSGESWLDAYDRDGGGIAAGTHLQDASRAFRSLRDTLRTLASGGALTPALAAEAGGAAAIVERVEARLAGFAGADAQARAGALAEVAGELGPLHAFVDAVEFGKAPLAGELEVPGDADLAEPGALRPASPASPDALAGARAAAAAMLRVHAEAEAPEVHALRAALQAAGEQAAIDDDAALRRSVAEATTQLNAWLAGSADAAQRLVAVLAEPLPPAAPAAPAPALVDAAAPADHAALDAELLDIFLHEAEDVLASIARALDGGLAALADADTLSRVRRGFHTLKGSSRMVGLARYGEAAWAVEQVLNLWIAEAREARPELLELLRQAHAELEPWLAGLRQDAACQRDVDALLAAAQAVRDGRPAAADAADAADARPAMPADEAPIPLHDAGPDAAAGAGEVEFPRADDDGRDAPDEAAQTGADAAQDANVIPFRLAGALSGEDDHYKVIGPIRIGLPLYNVYLQEADGLIRQFATDLSEWRHEGRPCPSELALRVAHTLQGSAATVALEPVREVAEALEGLLLQLAAHPVALHPGDFRLLEQAVERLRGMLHQFAAGVWPQSETALCRSLAECRERMLMRPRLHVGPAPGSVLGLGAMPDGSNGSDLADASDMPVSMLFGAARVPVVPHEAGAAGGEPAAAALHQAVVIPMPALRAPGVEARPAPVMEQVGPVGLVEEAAAGEPEPALDRELVEIFLEEAQASLPELGRLLRTWEAAPVEDMRHGGLVLRALHTLKGSARMAGAMALGQSVHEMETLLDASLRGNRVGPALFARLYAWYDRILAHAEALQAGRLLPADDPEAVHAQADIGAAGEGGDGRDGAEQGGQADGTEGVDGAAGVDGAPPDRGTDAPPAGALAALPPAAPGPAGVMPGLAPAMPAAEPAERQRALVRVQARTLDNLINDAGEVSVARARVDSELGALRTYLGELNDNVARLRTQLREIEIQAESQMASRIADSRQKQEFDPLEFDRFTRFQELTRMMAESVNDVATVEQNLQRGFDRAAGDLEAQARLTRGLQRSLMQARMVQFDALAERLYRVVRQAAAETGKEVRLLIKGGTVEIDRSVLDRMAGPIEHLIRNAVVHGIEPAEARRAAGKPSTGALTLELQQEGNEVVLHFVDDGAGLDLPRIRARAVQRQLLAPDDEAGEARLTELIFTPGFTTTDTISELAGRGVGMDVVRAETVALGGRIALTTEAGRGTRFTLHLPLTTAITQVLLVMLGGRLFAIPSGMIDQVQQLRAPALAEAYNRGSFAYGGEPVPFHYFGALLEESPAIAAGSKYSPVVVTRSGAERVAVHVDEVVGNREVVVKHIGPHLARLDGIAGATTLGDGEIVLIYNPVVLAQRHAQARGEALRGLPPAGEAAPSAQAARLTGAVAELGAGSAAAVAVAGLGTQPTVMVVDDSLTVRKAAHRLLTRAGYQVVLARDGVDALKQLQDVMPDAMLVDIEMPHMDGFDLTRNVRADARTAHMPLVMITSRTAEKHRRYAAEIGVNVYLGKPYNEDELLGTLHQLIGPRAAGTAGSVGEMLGDA